MPNHIQNRLQFFGNAEDIEALLTHIQSGEGEEHRLIDFQTIIPMPADLNVESSSFPKTWAEICLGLIDFKGMFAAASQKQSFADRAATHGIDGMLNYMNADIAFQYLLGERGRRNVKEMEQDDFETFIQMLKNYRTYGYLSWYEWSNRNWGTKWNAYDADDKRNTKDTLYFLTANGTPVPVIGALAKKFPQVGIIHTWADEDTGSRVGRIEYSNGNMVSEYRPQNQSLEAYDIYFELHPDDKANFQLVDEKYQRIETD